MKSQFAQQIVAFNNMYGLPVNTVPTNLGVQRLKDFKHALQNELNEIDDIIEKLEKFAPLQEDETVSMLTDVSDLLGDLQVYCASEMAKWGLPLDTVLDIIMASNASKLGADGKPIVDERGKVQKGPNYWKPEPAIREVLELKLHLGEPEDGKPDELGRQKYVGTKTVYATPMNRLVYNEYRGWQLPSNENGADEGYLVEYTDGGKPNDTRHEGYISWSPKDVFDNAYRAI